jgi:hypothetical protein
MDTFRNNLIYQFLGEYVTAHRNRSMKWIVLRVIRCQLRSLIDNPPRYQVCDFIFDCVRNGGKKSCAKWREDNHWRGKKPPDRPIRE